MRVLHVITGLGVGGAEIQLRLLVRHLPAESEVVTLTDPGPTADAIRADGVPVTHLGMSGNRDLSALPRLARLIRSRRPDVVHTHLYRACVYGRPAARLAGVRTVVASEHSLGVTQIEGRSLGAATRLLYRVTERLGSGTLAVSETVAHRLAAWGVPAERVVVAPNGIDPEPFRFSEHVRARTRAHLGIPQDAYVVGGVGRQVRGKNFADLIRAVAAAGKDAHLLLAGDGPERVPLLRIVHSLGIAHRVHLTGPDADPGTYAPQVPELLAAMDLFVSPSAEESFGVAVVEALAAGLPVLYVNCPALEDLPPLDAPGARQVAPYEIAAAIRRELLAGPRRLPVPAAVEHYHIGRTAQAVMALYAAATGTPVPAVAPAAASRARPAAGTARAVPGQLVPGPAGPAPRQGAGPGAEPGAEPGAGPATAPGTGPEDALAAANGTPGAAPGGEPDGESSAGRADAPAAEGHEPPAERPADTPEAPTERPAAQAAVPAPGGSHEALAEAGEAADAPPVDHAAGTPRTEPRPDSAAAAQAAVQAAVPAPGGSQDEAADTATSRANAPHVPAPAAGPEAARPDGTAPGAVPPEGAAGRDSAAGPAGPDGPGGPGGPADLGSPGRAGEAAGSTAQPPAGSTAHADNR